MAVRLAALAACALALSGASAQALRLPVGAEMPSLPGEQRLEPARRHAAGRGRLGCHRALDRGRRPHARRLRLGAVGGRADRNPDHRRRPQDPAFARELRVRGRVRQGALSDPAQRQDRRRAERRRRPSCAPARQGQLQALRALRALPEGRRRLERRLGRDLQPALEPPAPCRLDVGRRGRPARSSRGSPATTR